jgi:hypothetical protein
MDDSDPVKCFSTQLDGNLLCCFPYSSVLLHPKCFPSSWDSTQIFMFAQGLGEPRRRGSRLRSVCTCRVHSTRVRFPFYSHACQCWARKRVCLWRAWSTQGVSRVEFALIVKPFLLTRKQVQTLQVDQSHHLWKGADSMYGGGGANFYFK